MTIINHYPAIPVKKKSSVMTKNNIPYAFRRMIRTGLCLLLAVILLSWVQVAEGLKDKIDVGFKQASVLGVLQYLEKNTRLKFSYNLDDLQQVKPLTIEKKVRTVESLLSEISARTSLQFRQTEDMILVKVPAPQANAAATPVPVQDQPVKGTIRSSGGEALPGVSVQVKGTSQGVITDEKGQFRFANIPAGAVLLVSYIGFDPQEVMINGRQDLAITLATSSKVLDQVVVVGYGTQSKRNVTSAITSVKGSVIENMATNNPVNALQGRVAGLTVTSPGGSPGAVADVRLRGMSTYGPHQPLYIIDGTPGDPYYLNNNDIASIEVLKDGAAASIYGSLSANGVILITTKKGKKGAPKIEFNGYYSFVSPTSKMKLLDAEGYKKVHEMMYRNAGIAANRWPAYITKQTGVNTNWLDEINQQGIAQNYNLNVSGGGDYFNYALSGNILDEKGTFIGTGFKKKSLRVRNEYTKGRLNIQTILTYAETSRRSTKFAVNDAYFQSPLLSVLDPQSKYGYGLQVDGLPKFENPVAVNHYNDGYTNVQYFNGNVRLGLDLWKGFRFVTNLNMASSNQFIYAFNPPYRGSANDPQVPFANLTNQRGTYKEKLMENLLYYDLKTGKHSISVLAGYTAQEKTSDWMNLNVAGKTTVYVLEDGQIVPVTKPAGFPDSDFNTINGGNGGTFTGTGTRDRYIRLSTLGRINYAYDGKYLLQVSVRRDGSSVFGANRRYGVFPSFSAGWNIQQERFMENVRWLNMLKLRGSYGRLGTESSLGYYDHQALMNIYNTWAGGYVQGTGSTPWPGAATRLLENRDLRWETSISTNAGFDAAVLDNRLSIAFNYFNNVTKDLLIRKEIAPSAGLDDPILNVGKMRNRGWELEMTWAETKKDFGYNVTGTVSMVKNEVMSLANANQAINGTGLKYGTGPRPNKTTVGREAGAFYLYEADGIFQSDAEAASYVNKAGKRYQPNAKAGDIRFRDTNGDGVIDNDDKTYQGSGFPKVEFGLNLGFNYKGFDLQLFWQGVAGNKIFNGNKYELQGMDAGRNFDVSTLNAWTPENPNTDIPRAVLGDPNFNTRESTRFLEKGDYLRLKSLQLGYTFAPGMLERVKIARLRIYVSGQNLLTFTKYTGVDPEVVRTEVLNNGTDRMLYPQSKNFMTGLQLEF